MKCQIGDYWLKYRHKKIIVCRNAKYFIITSSGFAQFRNSISNTFAYFFISGNQIQSPEFLNPKWNKAKLLGFTLLSQNPTSSISTSSGSLPPVSHLLPRPTEKNQLLGPHKRYWSEILRICSNSPNLIFGLVLVNPIGSSNWHS